MKTSTKKAVLFILFFFLLFVFILSVNKEVLLSKYTFDPYPLPSFSLKRLNGEIFHASKIKNPIVITFWATWCESCKEDLKIIDELRHLFPLSPITVIGIALDKDSKTVKEILNQRNIDPTFPILIDSNGDVAEKFEVNQVPETFIVNNSGIVVKRFIGTLSFQKEIFIEFVKGLQESSKLPSI